ncbi:MAG: hypothetical protein PHP82_03075 [Candidatus ainarchaeum sp.]|nr:hypothetical protein [Candidatus ainarchaeum sp.]
MGIDEEMMDTFGGGQVTWHKVHKKRQMRYHSPKIYEKSLLVLLVLIFLSLLPLFYTTTGELITNINLIESQNKIMIFVYILACFLILLSGINSYKKGLRYGAYILGIFTALMLLELYNPNYHPSIAFFGIIIVLIFSLVTKKK